MKKEDEIAATNKLLEIIRGEVEFHSEEISPDHDLLPDDRTDIDLPDPLEKSPLPSRPPESQPSPQEEEMQPTPLEEIQPAPLEETRSASLEETQPAPLEETQSASFEEMQPAPLIDSFTPKSGEDVQPDLKLHQARGGRKKIPELLNKQQGDLRVDVKSTLGLDIGSHYIKFVQIQRKMNKQKLISWGIMGSPLSASGDKRDPKIDTLRRLLGESSHPHIRVVSSIGGPSVIVRHIKFPPLSDKEIAESIKWEAKSYIPFPLREVNIDYQIVGRSLRNKQVDVLLVAVTKKFLAEHLEMLNHIHIYPQVVDINPLALINAYTMHGPKKEDRAVVLLDIGASTTILNIYQKDNLYFTRDIPVAGESFTARIQKEKQLDYEEAEKSKCDPAFPLDIIKPVLDNLIKEIRRSLIYYDNQTSRRGFSQVILSGGSCRLPGLVTYLSEELGLAVETAHPLGALQIDSGQFSMADLEYFSPQLALAVGLTNR